MTIAAKSDEYLFDDITTADLLQPSSRKWSAHPNLLNAWIAEMDFGVPSAVREVIAAAAHSGELGYLSPKTWGHTAVEASRFFARRYDWKVDHSRIHHAGDLMAAFDVFLKYFTEPGSRVVVPTPAYAPFLDAGRLHGREVVQVPGIRRQGHWVFDFSALDAELSHTPGNLVLVNPHNPTGTVHARADLEELATMAVKRNARVFADEVFAPLTLPGARHIPFASVSEAAARSAFTATSASKGWNIAGLKSAQIVLSNDRDQRRYLDFGFGVTWGSSSVGALAAAAAYRDGEEWLDKVVSQLDANRRLLAELLDRHLPMVSYSPPEATTVAWLDFSRARLPHSPSSFIFNNAGVALSDGGANGTGFEKHVRLVYATPGPLLREMITRIGDAVRSRGA